MAFWSGEKLSERCRFNVISDFDEARVDCNSYRIRMGNEYYCTSDSGNAFWDSATKQTISPGASFIVAPGQFGFLLSNESIKVPSDAMAFISIRAKIKFRGLINVSGFHIDPGYDGKLIFSVFNAGPSNIHISEGEEIFLIWFADLDRASTRIKEKPGYKSIPNDLINGMNREIVSTYSLAKDISSIKVNMRVQAIIFGAAVAFFFAVFGAGANFILQHGLLASFERITNMPGQATAPPPVATPAPIPSPAASPSGANQLPEPAKKQ